MPADAPGEGGGEPRTQFAIGGGNPQAEGAVKVPAILLTVVGGIGILFGLYVIFTGLTGANEIEQARQEMRQIPAYLSIVYGTGGVVIGVICCVASLIVVLGGMKMMALRGRGLAISAAILAMLPVTGGPCCVLGIPVGIWCLVVLTKPEIRSAFR
ncbi:MAG: hypothetical protein ACYTGB_05200 [Planctomycetota bacterium]|jgi:hypothetical protein